MSCYSCHSARMATKISSDSSIPSAFSGGHSSPALQGSEYFADRESRLTGLAPLLRELAGGRVRIDVGVLPKSHYLSKDAILHTVGALLDPLTDEHLEKLEVDGEDEAGNNHVVDFIDCHFRGHEALAATAPRHTDIALLKDSIGKAFDTSRVYLSTPLRSRAA